MPCISCRSIFDFKVNLHVAKGVRKSNRFTFFLPCFQHLSLKHSPELLQVCYCFFSCCCFCCFLWAMASSVFYHKSCPILSYKLELHEFLLVRQERTSRGRVLFLTPCNAIDLWPSDLVYYPLLSPSLSHLFSLSLCMCFPAGVATGSFWLCAASGVVTRDSWRAYQQMIEVSS